MEDKMKKQYKKIENKKDIKKIRKSNKITALIAIFLFLAVVIIGTIFIVKAFNPTGILKKSNPFTYVEESPYSNGINL